MRHLILMHPFGKRFFTVFTLTIICSVGFGQNSFPLPAFEQINVMMPMRDGIRLATNIYRPDSLGSYPVLLLRTPYGNSEKGRQGEYFFVQHGYAVVVQNTRGRYNSEGTFEAFQSEGQDGFDTQEWIGQQPWCNGKIGTFGGSYEGLTQWMPAAFQSKYLKTMFVGKSFSNPYKEVYQGGAFRIARFCPWSYQMTIPKGMDDERLEKVKDSLYRHIPLIDHEGLLGWRIPFLSDWMAHPEQDQFWAGTTIKDYSKLKIPVYNMGGWFDSFLNGTVQNYLQMSHAASDPMLRAGQRLTMGPWIHGNESRKAGELDFGESAEFDEKEVQLHWFNAYLKGIDDPILTEPPVRIFVMGKNEWRNEQEWPLARTQYKKYYFQTKGKANTLQGQGLLDTLLAKGNSTDTFTYDPMNPVRNIGNMQPLDQRQVESRNDVLVFSSAVLKKDLEVTGPVKVILHASSSASVTDFTAKLLDVYPDGRAIGLREGIIRTSYRDGDTALSEIQPGKVYTFEIDLWSTSNVFKAGHRLRVEISSSNFPMFDRNLNTSLNPSVGKEYIKARQTIYHSKQYPSCIVLPVINN